MFICKSQLCCFPVPQLWACGWCGRGVRAVRGEEGALSELPADPQGCAGGNTEGGGLRGHATEGPRGLMPARALGCESQEPRPVGVSGAFGARGACGSSALRLPPRPWPPPGFEKDDSRKGGRARERDRGRWSRGITGRLETPLARGRRRAAGPGILSTDNFANSESRRPASPASPPLACPRGLAAFGAPAVRFPWRGEEGSGCWHLLVRTPRLPSCSVEIMRVPVRVCLGDVLTLAVLVSDG